MNADEEILLESQNENESITSSPADSITVTRNETTETMTIHDDTNEDAHATYEYTKHKEEETMEGIVQTDNMDDEDDDAVSTKAISGQGLAFIHSSSKYENVQLTGGSTAEGGRQTVTVKISKQRREQRVHITTQSSTKKKPSSLTKPKKKTSTKAAASSTTRNSTGKGGECLRRIKREWKDAVKMGIAYDWINMRTINTKSNQQQKDDRHGCSNANDYVRIGPFGKNLLRWHFSVLGPSNSPYHGGIYHGRVLLPKNYPGSPPRVQMLTPSGRFLPGADICLSASSYHPETWTPRWTVLSLVDALRLRMLTEASEIGGMVASSERRRECAEASRGWRSAGVVDHGRMVANGIFPVDGGGLEDEVIDMAVVEGNVADELFEDEPTNVMIAEGDSGPLEIDELQQPPSTTKSQNGTHDTEADKSPRGSTSEHHHTPSREMSTTKAAKKAKNQKTPGQSKDEEQPRKKSRVNATKSKTAKAAKKKTENERTEQTTVTSSTPAKRKVSSSSDNEHQQQGILSIMLKRIAIESIKLPLRILAILLRILSGLESLLTSFLDGL